MCNKKPYEKKWEAKLALRYILKNSEKSPWRDEIAVYMCDECEKYHVSSIVERGDYIPQKIKDQTYFDYQKEKWGGWLQNYSSKGAVINKRNKRYGT